MVTESKLGVNGFGGSVGGIKPVSNSIPNKPDATQGGPQSFEGLLDNKIGTPKQPGPIDVPRVPSGSEGLKFSQHAAQRMVDRGISFKPEELARLSDAVDKAAKKGSKESLVLMGDNALIVSVKNRTVVTAMDREAMKENVFTNIDSTVIL
jgi:flagellar operon protein